MSPAIDRCTIDKRGKLLLCKKLFRDTNNDESPFIKLPSGDIAVIEVRNTNTIAYCPYCGGSIASYSVPYVIRVPSVPGARL